MSSGESVLIIGASGHGRSVLDIVCQSNNCENVFFIDDTKEINSTTFGIKVIGGIKDLPKIYSVRVVKGVIIAIGDNYSRSVVAENLREMIQGIEFLSAIHPTAYIGRDAKIGHGTVVMASAVIGSGSVIGKHSIINTSASVDHDCKIGNYSSVGPAAVLGGNVEVDNCSAIGIGSTVIEKIKIGSNTVIGAGSVVLQNIGSDLLAYGSPAKNSRMRNKEERYLR